MSTTLSLVEILFSRACMLEQLGLRQAACRAWLGLVRMQELPEDFAEQAHAHLGELFLERKRFGKARRHLTIALEHRPDNAHYHHLLARALDEDPKSDPNRTTYHFRRCLELDLDNPVYLADFGGHALERGWRDEGLTALREAFELAGHDYTVVAKVVEALQDEGEWEEAAAKIHVARFLAPQDARLEKLWERHQFQEALARQSETRSEQSMTEEPVLLRFEAVAQAVKPARAAHKFFRVDAASGVPSSHLSDSQRIPG